MDDTKGKSEGREGLSRQITRLSDLLNMEENAGRLWIGCRVNF